jgi:GGDEF domain-containing protein
MLGSLTTFARRRGASARTPGRELTEPERQELPGGFDAVAEALASGSCPAAACAVAGRALAWDGVSLGEALTGLRDTYAALGGAVPDFAAVEALSVAWSEATLEFLHDVSCEDPLTGLASLPHLRTRLAEVYREAERAGGSVRTTRALVVVDVGGDTGGDAPTDSFGRALRLASVADALRTVFSGEETLARVAPQRVLVLCRRTSELGETVALARDMLEDLGLGEARIWIEGLPEGADLAVRLLSEMAR